jgi:hypothetical protein
MRRFAGGRLIRMMTSACFVHMVPPYFATGAGAEMRRSLGTAVLWGVVGVTHDCREPEAYDPDKSDLMFGLRPA